MLFRKPAIVWLLALLCVVGVIAQPAEDAFRPLAKNHRWFELRSTAGATASPPPLNTADDRTPGRFGMHLDALRPHFRGEILTPASPIGAVMPRRRMT